MWTKNEIITEFYRRKEFNDCINKQEPEHLRDDLRAEVMLILLETSEEKIKALHEKDELKYYAVRIILNLIQSKTSSFFKKYRQSLVELDINVHYDAKHRGSVTYSQRC